jgi:hypothetical protein
MPLLGMYSLTLKYVPIDRKSATVGMVDKVGSNMKYIHSILMYLMDELIYIKLLMMPWSFACDVKHT